MDRVCIELTDGRKMNFDLDRKNAPLSVENFIALARDGFYDGLCFHRVIENFMIQGGGFKYNGGLQPKKAPATVKGEFASNGVNNTIKHVPGVISMARTMVPDSASSQFFICVETLPHLDGQYAAFGKTADDDSLAVAMEISAVKTRRDGYYDDVPVHPVVIKTVTVL